MTASLSSLRGFFVHGHAESGYDYFGARFYDPRIGRFFTVDRFASKYPALTPYQYATNNPPLVIDINGDSTFVTQNADGTYSVKDGNLSGKEDDTGIYLKNADGSRTLIGNSETPYSFVNDGVFVEGARIDFASTEGQDFVDAVVLENPDLLQYALFAFSYSTYDFKTKGMDPALTMEAAIAYTYRGGMTAEGRIASARDFGNIAAGLVAARNGLTWSQARFGFDAYESIKQGRPCAEGVTSQTAQWRGFMMGVKLRTLETGATNAVWRAMTR